MRYRLILIFLLCRIPLTSANPVQHGTYAAIYYTNEFVVAAIDSRTTDSASNVISDSICKLHPLSNELFFLDIGLSRVPQSGQKSADLEALAAKALATSDRERTPRDLAQEWMSDTKTVIANIPDTVWHDIVLHVFDPLQNNVDHTLARGIFVGKTAAGGIGGAIAEITLTDKYDKNVSANVYDMQDNTIYSFDMTSEYSRYKATHSEPERKIFTLEWPNYLTELVQFMIDGETRRDVGGSVAALALRRGRTIEWTRRPAFCRE
jgi:hypothetical protein